MSRWIFARRFTVLGGWAVLLIVAMAGAARLDGVLVGGSEGIAGSPSVRVIDDAVRHGMPAGTFYQFLAVVRSDRVGVRDPAFARAVMNLESALIRSAQAGAVRTFWNTGRSELLGRDGHSALVQIRSTASDFQAAETRTGLVRAAVAAAGMGGDFTVSVTSMPALYYDLNRQSSSDLLHAERIGLPITALILLAVFGAPLAALLPIVLGVASVTVSLGALYALSRFMPVTVFAQNVVSMIGLGVGVDYALFVLSSFRSALARGRSPRAAANHAMHHAGHTVIFSGLAVLVGFSALFLVHVKLLRAMAVGGMLVVLTAGTATLTLLPVLLTFAGSAINWPRGKKLSAGPAEDGVWSRWAGLVMGRPWTFLAAGIGVLAIFLVPVMRLKPWDIGPEQLTPELEARAGYDALRKNFARGMMGPTVLLVAAAPGRTVWEPACGEAVTRLAGRLGRDPRIAGIDGFPRLLAALRVAGAGPHPGVPLPEPMRRAVDDVVSPDSTRALIVLYPAEDAESRSAMSLVEELRRDRWPEFSSGTGIVGVGGATAMIADFDREVFTSLRRVIPAVLLLTFVVLLILFQSVLIPLKAIVLNLCSVLAAYGFLIYVFQDGHGARLIGLVPPGGLNSFVVLMLFTILFGLSMDYEVFLLGRIRSEYLVTGDNRRSVAAGLQGTAGIISSAAAIMISIFLSFGFTRLVATREFGLGLAFAVALDATLIRLVLVPVLMVLLGSLNWWMPGRGIGKKRGR